MSRIKRAAQQQFNIDELDVTPEALDYLDSLGELTEFKLDALESLGANDKVLVLDYQTFAREYQPSEAFDDKFFPPELA